MRKGAAIIAPSWKSHSLPMRCASEEFVGQAQPGEFYPFQIGVLAARKPITALQVRFSDLRGEGNRRIPASAIRCFNLQGTDWLGRTVRFNRFALPESITSNGHEILASPVQFVVETAQGRPQWRSARLRRVKQNEAAVEWESSAESEELIQRVRTRMEFDGCALFTVTLRAKREVDLRDVRLEVPFRREIATYMMGMGRRGGKRPEQWEWRWHPNRINHLVWVGDVDAGMQVKLEVNREVWGVLPELPPSWHNEGRGGCVLQETADAFVMRAFSGERRLSAGEEVQFLFRFLITPFKPLDPNRWLWRIPLYAGGNIAHVRHADAANPNINYPMRTWREMAQLVQQLRQSPPLRRRGALQYPARGNIDLSQGALHLRVRVNFDPSAGTAGDSRYNQSLFSLLLPGGESIGFYWNIEDRGMRAYLHRSSQTDNPYPVLIGSHQPEWKRGEVHTVTLAWGERFAIYVDGRLAAQAPHRGTLQTSLENAILRPEGQGFLLQAIKMSRSEYREGAPIVFASDSETLLLDTFTNVRERHSSTAHRR